jgi:hypothetical protein
MRRRLFVSLSNDVSFLDLLVVENSVVPEPGEDPMEHNITSIDLCSTIKQTFF